MPWKEKNKMDQKQEFAIKSVQRGVNFSKLCEEYEISRKTGYKWKEHFVSNGLSGLQEKSRRPRSSPAGIREDIVCELVRLKKAHMTWGPKKIHKLYCRKHGSRDNISLTSVKRILDKAGLVKHKRRRKRRDPERVSNRRKPEAPNEVWTVDFKGWWHVGAKRCEPLTVRDEYSRYMLGITALSTTKTAPVKAEFKRLFKKHGLPETIRSDNGCPFASWNAPLGLSALSVWWVSLGIMLDRIEPGKPYQNGAHERMHRDVKMELQGLIEGGMKEQQVEFDFWREEFNEIRPHEALDMKTPADFYTKSPRKYEGDIDTIEYPALYPTRKVFSSGEFSFMNIRFLLSTTLAGWDIGLKYITPTHWSVWFDYLNLGEIDLDTRSFTPKGAK